MLIQFKLQFQNMNRIKKIIFSTKQMNNEQKSKLHITPMNLSQPNSAKDRGGFAGDDRWKI